ncbi:hypothetical protein L4C36_17260 [Photobacterium japonica]|uniref:hypothetical protein n=1 Tax=Photobacterium japonica TaxID=2910235 RepID=UPI003D0F2CE4
MNRQIPLNKWLHKALIEKEMDGFSVLEIRNTLLPDTYMLFDREELRKLLYRQLYNLLAHGYLEKMRDEVTREKRYFKTDAFRALEFVAAKRTQLSLAHAHLKSRDYNPFISHVSREKAQFEAELRIVLGEVDVYKRVLTSFPEQSALVEPLYEKSKDYSAELLGRINALSKLSALPL